MKAILCKGVCIVSRVVTNEGKVYVNMHWSVTLIYLLYTATCVKWITLYIQLEAVVNRVKITCSPIICCSQLLSQLEGIVATTTNELELVESRTYCTRAYTSVCIDQLDNICLLCRWAATYNNSRALTRKLHKLMFVELETDLQTQLTTQYGNHQSRCLICTSSVASTTIPNH